MLNRVITSALHRPSTVAAIALTLLATPAAHAAEPVKHKTSSASTVPSTASDKKPVKAPDAQKSDWQASVDEVRKSLNRLSDDISTGTSRVSESTRKNLKTDLDKTAQRIRELGDDLTSSLRKADNETRQAAQTTLRDLSDSLAKLSAKLEEKSAAGSGVQSDASTGNDEEYPDDVDFPELED